MQAMLYVVHHGASVDYFQIVQLKSQLCALQKEHKRLREERDKVTVYNIDFHQSNLVPRPSQFFLMYVKNAEKACIE